MATTLNKKKYEESQKVKDAYEKYTQYKDSQKPADYSFSDSERLAETENALFNAPEFKYNVKKDPLYSQYKETYTREGERAMRDTVGNASALTGGYANSYAQTVGNAAYNEHLNKLNDVIPELYSAAYSRYSDDLDRLESKLGYLSDKNSEEYSRYLDSYKAYSDEVDDLRDLYLKEYGFDLDIQDSEWESAYKLAMAEQQKQIADAELGYKYYAAEQNRLQNEAALAAKQSQFEAELALQRELAEKDNSLREYELRLEREKIGNEDAHYWAEFNEKTADEVRADEFYTMMLNEQYYDVIAALDYNHEDDEMVRYRALALGIDKDLIDAYFDAKY